MMGERTHELFDLWPEKLVADTAYGSAPNLAWLIEDRGHRTSRPGLLDVINSVLAACTRVAEDREAEPTAGITDGRR